jgi:hypothetical protein
MTARRAGAVVRAALAGTTWGAARSVRIVAVSASDASTARHDLVVHVTATERRADVYAAHAHELVQLLFDSEKFTRIEADLPTVAFDPDGLGDVGVRSRRGAADAQDPATAAHDWALREMRVPAAMALMRPAARGGTGIVIGHPDSGYSDHPMLGLTQLDLTRDRDVISGDDDARDPLHPPRRRLFNLLPNPGHGTSTASVLVGAGEGAAPGGFRGVAPSARLVPIRATESVVQVFDTDVAEAVHWARRSGCHVVSMSLGGKGLFGLEDAIQEAVDAGLVVMAAAGNQVGFVTAPASYDNCLAVAASTAASTPWDGSSRGGQVDVTAPGARVWCAQMDWRSTPPVFVLTQSDGTSYAVAHLAGVASLWLAHHGRDAIIARFGLGHVQAVFLTMLRAPGVCRVPAGWDHHRWGTGIVDAAALLRAPLPAPHAFMARRGAVAADARTPLDRVAASLDLPIDDVRRLVDGLLGDGAADDLDLLRRFEGELMFQLSDPAVRASWLAAGRRVGAADDGASVAVRGASPQFRRKLAAGPSAIGSVAARR